jgi:hypothetical protein
MHRLAPLLLLVGCSLYETSPPPDAKPAQTSGSPSESLTLLDGSGLDTCFEGDVATPLLCTVSDVLGRGTPNQTVTLMPPCTSGVEFPCWYDAADANCPPSGLALVVVRATPAPQGTVTDATCVAK